MPLEAQLSMVTSWLPEVTVRVIFVLFGLGSLRPVGELLWFHWFFDCQHFLLLLREINDDRGMIWLAASRGA